MDLHAPPCCATVSDLGHNGPDTVTWSGRYDATGLKRTKGKRRRRRKKKKKKKKKKKEKKKKKKKKKKRRRG